MYQTKTMEKLEMMECPQCSEPMPVKRRELGYHVCVNCSTVSAKRGIPVMRGTGDHTWVDLEVMTQEQFEDIPSFLIFPLFLFDTYINF